MKDKEKLNIQEILDRLAKLGMAKTVEAYNTKPASPFVTR